MMEVTPSIQGVRFRVHILNDPMHLLGSALEGLGCEILHHKSTDELATQFHPARSIAVIVNLGSDVEGATDLVDRLQPITQKKCVLIYGGERGPRSLILRYAISCGFGQFRECASVADVLAEVSALSIRNLQSGSSPVIGVREGLLLGHIYPVLQPKLSLRCDAIVSAELLTRVSHPSGKQCSPYEFISNLGPLERRLLTASHITAATTFLAELVTAKPMRIAINVSASELIALLIEARTQNPDMLELYKKNFIFEITEEELGDFTTSDLKNLYSAAIEGIKISLDDFGTGSCTYARLAQIPFAELKMDKSVVQGCSRSSAKAIIVRSIIDMTHEMGASCLAEGVEDYSDLEFLANAHCDEVQGYAVAKPMTMPAFSSFIQKRSKPGFQLSYISTIKR